MVLAATRATTTYRTIAVDGLNIFYREAGPKDAPTLLPLHGFPSSSRRSDTLIPFLADRYRLVAPDYPGFGHSDAPPSSMHSRERSASIAMRSSFRIMAVRSASASRSTIPSASARW